MRHELSGFLRATGPGRVQASGPGIIRFMMAASHITIECKRYGCMKNLLACYANCRFSTRCDELRNEISDKPEQATSDINAYLGERGMRLIQIQFPKRGLKFVDPGKQASDTRSGKSLLRVERKDAAGGPRAVAQPGKVTVKRSAATVPLESFGSRPRPKRRLKPGLKAVKTVAAIPATGALRTRAAEPRKESSPKKRPAGKRAARVKATVSKAARVRPSRDVKDLVKVVAKAPATAKAEPRKAMNQSTGMSEQLTDKEKSAKPNKTSSNKRSASSGARPGRKQGKKFIILEGRTASLVDEKGLMMHIMSGSSTEARYFEVNEVEARVQIVTKK